ncbi:MAG: sigma-70 family RNA polymerase sigma factor [Planctomycetota bacterium]|jgi:RNA polymerase sigma-70 factor (ECF subfamily)|nr:sigma-70 family RNA polymerase sigma factor [Planctomycetota bacterium]
MVTESETALLIEADDALDSQDDRLLIARYVADGDRPAMEEVLRRHWPTAVRVARRYTGNDSDAEDCVQEALLRACCSAAQYSGRGTVRAWLLQAVVNACRMRFREEDARDRRQRVVGEAETLLRRSEGPDLERSEQRQLVREAVADLPERYRLPMWLRYVEDLSPQEVAAALERPEATVRSQIHRGLKQLTERLERRGIVAASLLLMLLGDLAAEPTSLPPPALQAPPMSASALAGTGALGPWLAVAVASCAVATVALGFSLGGDGVAPAAKKRVPAQHALLAEPVVPAAFPARADLLFDLGSDLKHLVRYAATVTTEHGLPTGHAREPLRLELASLDGPSGPALGFVLDARWDPQATETVVIQRPFPAQALALECTMRVTDADGSETLPLQLTALLRTDRDGPRPRSVLERHPEVLRASGLLDGQWVSYRAELQHCQHNGVPATELRYFLGDRLYMRSRLELRSQYLLPVSVTGHVLEVTALQVRELERQL